MKLECENFVSYLLLPQSWAYLIGKILSTPQKMNRIRWRALSREDKLRAIFFFVMSHRYLVRYTVCLDHTNNSEHFSSWYRGRKTNEHQKLQNVFVVIFLPFSPVEQKCTLLNCYSMHIARPTGSWSQSGNLACAHTLCADLCCFFYSGYALTETSLFVDFAP